MPAKWWFMDAELCDECLKEFYREKEKMETAAFTNLTIDDTVTVIQIGDALFRRELEAKPEPAKAWLQEGDEVWLLADNGEICRYAYDVRGLGSAWLESGSLFPTKALAIRERGRRKAAATLMRFRMSDEKYREPTKAEWKNTKINKHLITWGVGDFKLGETEVAFYQYSTCAFVSRNAAQAAIAAIPEALEVLIKG
jgi:hypothetical protein